MWTLAVWNSLLPIARASKQRFPRSKKHFSLRETQNKKTKYPHLTTPKRQKASDHHLLATPTQRNCSASKMCLLTTQIQHSTSAAEKTIAEISGVQSALWWVQIWQLEMQQPATKPWRSKRKELSPSTLSLLRVTVTTGLSDHKTRLCGVNIREQAKGSRSVNW